MTAELKPCPFCGESAAFEQIGNRRQSTIVACTNCGARHECGEEWGHGASWNTRTDLSQAAFARAEKAEADRDEWRKTAIAKIEMADSTALRYKDAIIATLQARDEVLRSAAIAAGNAIVAIAADADPDISPLRKQMLRVKMEKAVKAAFTRDA